MARDGIVAFERTYRAMTLWTPLAAFLIPPALAAPGWLAWLRRRRLRRAPGFPVAPSVHDQSNR